MEGSPGKSGRIWRVTEQVRWGTHRRSEVGSSHGLGSLGGENLERRSGVGDNS